MNVNNQTDCNFGIYYSSILSIWYTLQLLFYLEYMIHTSAALCSSAHVCYISARGPLTMHMTTVIYGFRLVSCFMSIIYERCMLPMGFTSRTAHCFVQPIGSQLRYRSVMCAKAVDSLTNIQLCVVCPCIASVPCVRLFKACMIMCPPLNGLSWACLPTSPFVLISLPLLCFVVHMILLRRICWCDPCLVEHHISYCPCPPFLFWSLCPCFVLLLTCGCEGSYGGVSTALGTAMGLLHDSPMF